MSRGCLPAAVYSEVIDPTDVTLVRAGCRQISYTFQVHYNSCLFVATRFLVPLCVLYVNLMEVLVSRRLY